MRKTSHSIYISSDAWRRLENIAKSKGLGTSELIEEMAMSNQLSLNQIQESLMSFKQDLDGTKRNLDQMMVFMHLCMKIIMRRIPANNALLRDAIENKEPLKESELNKIFSESDQTLEFCFKRSGESVADFYFKDDASDPFPEDSFAERFTQIMNEEKEQDK